MIIYADMVADMFHFGHVNFLKQAKLLGDYLIVGITSDDVVKKYKRKPIMNEDERAMVVSSCRYVDKVIKCAPAPVTEKFIKKHCISLVVHGDKMSHDDLLKWYSVPIKMGIFRTIPRTKGISTSDIIKRVEDSFL